MECVCGAAAGELRGDIHQQASLTTGTIAYNDKLSTDFRHLDGLGMGESKRATRSGRGVDGCWVCGGEVVRDGKWIVGIELC
jgi:hypothetical protein